MPALVEISPVVHGFWSKLISPRFIVGDTVERCTASDGAKERAAAGRESIVRGRE